MRKSDEWTVYASVVDRTGTPVMGLSPADFAVRENGVAREILRVSPATDSLRIAVLVDTSQEMRNDLIDIRQSLRGFVNRDRSAPRGFLDGIRRPANGARRLHPRS